ALRTVTRACQRGAGDLNSGAFRINLMKSRDGGPSPQDRVHDKLGDRRRRGGPVPDGTRTRSGRYAGKSAEERRAERRRRFLDAALQLFGAGPGYRATTVTALSEAAGLSTRQFYEEFRTLEDVLAALHLAVNDRTEEAVLAAAARS